MQWGAGDGDLRPFADDGFGGRSHRRNGDGNRDDHGESEVLLPGNDSLRQFRGRPTMLLASLMAMLILAWTRMTRKYQHLRWAPVLTITLVLVLGITLTSCGGGSSGGGGGTVPTGTQAGTYTITVSASATAGSTTLTHTTKLTLVVQ